MKVFVAVPEIVDLPVLEEVAVLEVVREDVPEDVRERELDAVLDAVRV